MENYTVRQPVRPTPLSRVNVRPAVEKRTFSRYQTKTEINFWRRVLEHAAKCLLAFAVIVAFCALLDTVLSACGVTPTTQSPPLFRFLKHSKDFNPAVPYTIYFWIHSIVWMLYSCYTWPTHLCDEKVTPSRYAYYWEITTMCLKICRCWAR